MAAAAGAGADESPRREGSVRSVDEHWVSGDRPRVLLEYPADASPDRLATVLRDAGYAVAICDGPGDDVHGCSLIESGSCPAARDADVIVNGLGIAGAETGEVLRALQALHPDTPRVIELDEAVPESDRSILDGAILVVGRPSARTLLAAVDTAGVRPD